MTAGCGCACTSGGFCGGCGHAGCGGRPSWVALPDHSCLAMVRDALDAEDIRDWLTEHGHKDPEVAHAVVDELLLAVLRSIRDGHPDPAGLATAVLTVTDANFPRWCA